MAKINPALYGLSDINKLLDDLFFINENLVLLLDKNYKLIKSQKIIEANSLKNINTSFSNIINYSKKINGLKKDLNKKIKSGIINDDIINNFKLLNNNTELINDYILCLNPIRNNFKSNDRQLFSDMYDLIGAENNIINNVIIALENNIYSNKNKTGVEFNHLCEIKNGGQIFINNEFSGVTLPPKLSSLLKKLIELDKNGNYPLVKTKNLENRKKKNSDAFRTTLRRLRNKTRELFEIKNIENNSGESCYTVVFKN